MAFALAGLSAFCADALAEAYEANPTAVERDEDYAAGKKALEAKDWTEAARRFAIAARRDPENADLQNYLGYSHRNLKQYDQAFAFYKRSIELNPRHRGAHEYIGEAYLQVGDLAGAERHLAALRDICLLGCEELADLERAVAQFKLRK
jgi:tetratricopeptide (TPR) repeat protein